LALLGLLGYLLESFWDAFWSQFGVIFRTWLSEPFGCGSCGSLGGGGKKGGSKTTLKHPPLHFSPQPLQTPRVRHRFGEKGAPPPAFVAVFLWAFSCLQECGTSATQGTPEPDLMYKPTDRISSSIYIYIYIYIYVYIYIYIYRRTNYINSPLHKICPRFDPSPAGSAELRQCCDTVGRSEWAQSGLRGVILVHFGGVLGLFATSLAPLGSIFAIFSDVVSIWLSSVSFWPPPGRPDPRNMWFPNVERTSLKSRLFT